MSSHCRYGGSGVGLVILIVSRSCCRFGELVRPALRLPVPAPRIHRAGGAADAASPNEAKGPRHSLQAASRRRTALRTDSLEFLPGPFIR